MASLRGQPVSMEHADDLSKLVGWNCVNFLLKMLQIDLQDRISQKKHKTKQVGRKI